MSFLRIIIAFSFLMVCTLSHSQEHELYEEAFLETTTNHDKFKIYLDSIDKYLYRDAELTSKIIVSCDNLIECGLVPNDSLLYLYTMNQVLYKHSTLEPLEAYKIFINRDEIFNRESLSAKQIASADYLRAFTYMSVGDLESAQERFYQNIEASKNRGDTKALISNLYSLGQLYSDEKDYEAALKCYDEINTLSSSFEVRPSSLVLVQSEITEAKISINDFQGAHESIEKGLSLAAENDMNVLANDLLLLKGHLYLKQDNIKLAEKVYEELQANSENSVDANSKTNTKKLLAKLYAAKKMYPEAIQTHKIILNLIDSTDLRSKLEEYADLHEISSEMQSPKSAYSYLLKYNDILDQKLEDEKRQKTAYLKIKYDSEQKEEDNVILASQVLKNKTERQLLYALLGLVGLSLIILFGAFYQNKRYNKLLETEVSKRTASLKESIKLHQKANKELDEFNRILSHDLKEPLRSIVGFSQLAANNVTRDSKAHNYLGIVRKSGEQLSKLIDDVGKFRNTETVDSESKILINVNDILRKTVTKLEFDYPDKKLSINTSDQLPIIRENPTALLSIFTSILENSVKFNEQEEVKININYNSDSNYHIFEIEDNGIGVPNEYHNQIFDMFKRLNNRNEYEGSGLGLSVAKKMITDLGGSISVLKSKINEGTTMLLKLSR